MIGRAGRVIAVGAVVLAAFWGALALWFDSSASQLVAGLLAVGFAVICILMVALIRPLYHGLIVAIALVVVVALWWTSIVPSNTRDWTPDVARIAHATFNGNRITIENLRNFKYRSETDYAQRWEIRSYDLDRVRGLDMFLSYWGPSLIAIRLQAGSSTMDSIWRFRSRRARKRVNSTQRSAASSGNTN